MDDCVRTKTFKAVGTEILYDENSRKQLTMLGYSKKKSKMEGNNVLYSKRHSKFFYLLNISKKNPLEDQLYYTIPGNPGKRLCKMKSIVHLDYISICVVTADIQGIWMNKNKTLGIKTIKI